MTKILRTIPEKELLVLYKVIADDFRETFPREWRDFIQPDIEEYREEQRQNKQDEPD